jgi:hypothetical protein
VSFTEKDRTFINEVLALFYCRRGRAHGFRFKDWNDFTVTNGPLVAIPGGSQLAKAYEDPVNPIIRPIVKPCGGLVTDEEDHTPPVPQIFDALGALLVTGSEATWDWLTPPCLWQQLCRPRDEPSHAHCSR